MSILPQVYLDLVHNLTLLVALCIVSGFIESRAPRKTLFGRILQGLLFSLTAILGMLNPLDLGQGLIFDGRSVVISLAAYYYGPVAALLTVVSTVAVRVLIGGGGTSMGILVILASAATGLAFRRIQDPAERIPSGPRLFFFGLVVHALMIACMTALPEGMVVSTMLRLGPPVIVLYPLATLLVGKILSDQVTVQLQIQALQKEERRFRETLEFLPAPVCISNNSGEIVFINHLFTDTFGYELSEVDTLEKWNARAYPDASVKKQVFEQWKADIASGLYSVSGGPSRVYPVVCRDGGVRDITFSMRVFDDQFIVVLTDLTERHVLESKLERKIAELASIRDVTISSMAILSEFRDTETGAHIQRTKEYVKCMLEQLGDRNPYSQAESELVWHSAPLHDIGKVAIPDSILLKPDRLSDEEYEIMKRHVIFGSNVIKRTQELAPEVPFLAFASDIAEFHHERWDGKGYSKGLAGTEIPLSARIMAIADVYDACVSDRPYKEAMPHEQAVAIIAAGSGTLFDPELVECFLGNEEKFLRIMEAFGDR